MPHKPRAKDKRARKPDTGHRISDNGQRTGDQGKVVDPEPESKAAVAEPGVRWLRHRLAAGVVSGLVLWTTFPPMEWGPLAWIALTPLFWLATVVGAPGRTYLAAWAGGLVFWILAVPWLRLIGPGAWIGWIVLGAVFSLWWPLFLALARWARFRLGVPLILAAPIAWVTVEYLRAYFLTGFPWYYLAHSQYRFLHVIQIADVTGSLGVSLLIAMVNAWLVELVTIPLLRPDDSGRSRLTLGQSAAPLGRHHPGGDDPLLRRVPALDGPVPPGTAGRAVAVQPGAGEEEPRPRQDPGGLPGDGPPRGVLRTAPRPDRLAGDCLPVQLRDGRPGPGPGHLRSPGPIDPQHRAHPSGRMAEDAEGRPREPPRDDGPGRRADAGRLPGLGPRAGRAPSVQYGRPLPALPDRVSVLPQDAPRPVRRVHPDDRHPAVAGAPDPISRPHPLAQLRPRAAASSSWAPIASPR